MNTFCGWNYIRAWRLYSFGRWPVPSSPGKKQSYAKAIDAFLAHARFYENVVKVLLEEDRDGMALGMGGAIAGLADLDAAGVHLRVDGALGRAGADGVVVLEGVSAGACPQLRPAGPRRPIGPA